MDAEHVSVRSYFYYDVLFKYGYSRIVSLRQKTLDNTLEFELRNVVQQ